MQMCMDHWNELRKAIDDRGLTQFVSKDGKSAVENMKKQLEGEAIDPKTLDPLMEANNAIYAMAVKCGGPYLLSGDYCPLCELKKHKGTPEEWINGATDEVLEHFKKIGLIGVN